MVRGLLSSVINTRASCSAGSSHPTSGPRDCGTAPHARPDLGRAVRAPSGASGSGPGWPFRRRNLETSVRASRSIQIAR